MRIASFRGSSPAYSAIPIELDMNTMAVNPMSAKLSLKIHICSSYQDLGLYRTDRRNRDSSGRRFLNRMNTTVLSPTEPQLAISPVKVCEIHVENLQLFEVKFTMSNRVGAPHLHRNPLQMNIGMGNRGYGLKRYEW